jgi:hypothetical protein
MSRTPAASSAEVTGKAIKKRRKAVNNFPRS